ncbi:MAG: protein kinase [Deltaproteobacteria bacterium]|nr:protein kinase [Deltaproteobacteria bacterium]
MVEDFGNAAACFEKNGDAVQAAEMYLLVGDRRRAADNYEAAEFFTEAAECYAALGDLQREVELLEQAGNFLRVGLAFQAHGQIDEAIAVLQRVEAESADYVEAAALLGELFRGKGLFPLAIKKLQEVLGDEAVSKENIHIHFSLCLAYEEDSRFQDAVELLEKVLGCDYKYKDAEAHLGHCQEESQRVQAAEAKAVEGVKDSSGRYKIIGELGRGGMGIVFKSEDTVLDRLVAYKVLPNELRENPKALKNFLREAKSAAQLNHPNIVTVYDAGEQDGRFYIAMEHVEGTTLKEILRSRGAISPAGVRHVLVQVCEALAFAHEKKIVHRDIKPANIMWTGDKQAKIMDFGLAKVIEEVRNHTTVVAGTPYYMSPEQTLGKNVDYRTDIYSLGVAIFELATGELPFKEGNVPYHHVHTPTPDPRSINPKLPPLLAKIILKCMEKDPAKRYQTAREIITEIKTVMAQQKKKAEAKRNPPQ